MANVFKKITEKVKKDNERGARKAVIEDLFYDFHKNRYQVYWTNFMRGIFFGFGTALGGTLLVAIVIWALGQFAGWFPFIGNDINHITNVIQQSK